MYNPIIIGNSSKCLNKFSLIYDKDQYNLGLNLEKSKDKINIKGSADYKVNNNVEIALEQNLDFKNRKFGIFIFGVKYNSPVYTTKAKIDCNGILNLNANYSIKKNISVDLNLETSVNKSQKVIGLYESPVKFGIQLNSKFN